MGETGVMQNQHENEVLSLQIRWLHATLSLQEHRPLLAGVRWDRKPLMVVSADGIPHCHKNPARVEIPTRRGLLLQFGRNKVSSRGRQSAGETLQSGRSKCTCWNRPASVLENSSDGISRGT